MLILMGLLVRRLSETETVLPLDLCFSKKDLLFPTSTHNLAHRGEMQPKETADLLVGVMPASVCRQNGLIAVRVLAGKLLNGGAGVCAVA